MARGHVLDASVRLTPGRALPHRDHRAIRHRFGSVAGANAPINRRAGLPLDVAAVLRLQRVHGNRATTGMIARRVSPPVGGLVAPVPVVQRYVETGSADYMNLPENQPAPIGSGAPTFFAQQMTVDANKQVIAPLEQPNLKVADTGDMAIAAAPQPKEFYADQTVIAASNSKLEGVESPIRLVDTGRPLTVLAPGTRQSKQLPKVQPTMADQRSKAAFSDKCNEIASVVMGKADTTKEEAEAVFAGTGNTPVESKSLEFHGGSHAKSPHRETAGPSHVAEFLADNAGTSVTPTDLESNLTAGEGNMPSAATALKYGRANPAQLRQRSQEVGVNESAMPDVGEAFGTFAIQGGPGQPLLDYSKETPSDRRWLTAAERAIALKAKLLRMTEKEVAAALDAYRKQFAHYVAQPWTWHFAGVVARSGGDAVTLENYNRNDEIQKAYITAYQKAKQQHKAQIEEIAQLNDVNERTGRPSGRPMKELIEALPSLVVDAIDELNGELKGAGEDVITRQPDRSKLWFFQMYGAKAGQSFHEAMAKSGDFTNPLTIRWRDPVTDEFRQKRKDGLDEKAAELRRRHRYGTAKAKLGEVLPRLLRDEKANIDQTTSKQDVSESYRKAIDQLKSLDSVLINLP